MDMYTSNYDGLEAEVKALLLKHPESAHLQRVLNLLHTQGSENGGLHQLSEDFSNIHSEAFCVLQLHSLPVEYPDKFFEQFTLVMTLNDPIAKMDIFCDETCVDPSVLFQAISGGLPDGSVIEK